MEYADLLRPLTAGRFALMCGKCLRPSPPVPAPDAASALTELQRVGWTVHAPGDAPGARAFALCPACTASPSAEAKAPADAALGFGAGRKRRWRP